VSVNTVPSSPGQTGILTAYIDHSGDWAVGIAEAVNPFGWVTRVRTLGSVVEIPDGQLRYIVRHEDLSVPAEQVAQDVGRYTWETEAQLRAAVREYVADSPWVRLRYEQDALEAPHDGRE